MSEGEMGGLDRTLLRERALEALQIEVCDRIGDYYCLIEVDPEDVVGPVLEAVGFDAILDRIEQLEAARVPDPILTVKPCGCWIVNLAKGPAVIVCANVCANHEASVLAAVEATDE